MNGEDETASVLFHIVREVMEAVHHSHGKFDVYWESARLN